MKRKIAILGGGVASLTAAYELSRPERADDYEVTVYQIGWRLGGKGASSRNTDENDRIEEHGLHLWMGCYENAFRIIRDCYDALGRAPGEPLATWTDAFRPHQTTVLEEKYQGRWHHWPTTFPVLDTRPGEGGEIADARELTLAMMRWLWRAITPVDDDPEWGPPPDDFRGDGAMALLVRPFEIAMEALSSHRPAHRVCVRALKVLRSIAWRMKGRSCDDKRTRWALLTIDFLTTNLIGILTEGFLVPPSGNVADCTYQDWLDNLQRIDHLHYPDWLRLHGAREPESCIVRGLGDAVFNSAHRGSAAAALNGVVRLNLTFRGSVFFKMQAGMGETIFTPLYEVLRSRGVRFEFFTRVDALRVDKTNTITSVEIARQVRLKDDAYEPLIDIDVDGKNLPCWPHHPRWNQIASVVANDVDLESPRPVLGEAYEVLRLGRDFDDVVLGISIGAFETITADLIAANARWERMVRNVATTATRSVQLWFETSHDKMGWHHGPAVATAYEEALDTWADMTHLLPTENWDGKDVESCSYFVGSLTDVSDPDTQAARVRREAEDWLDSHIGHILPGARSRGRFDRDKVVSRYERANVLPSDRYVLSVPGSGRHRLPSDQSGFNHLYLAGDWTRTGMNVGSVEAAVMSGLRAARGVTKSRILIVGDFR